MKCKSEKKENLGEHIDIVNELCPVFGPRLTKKDSTLEDALNMRVLRSCGIDISEKDAFLLKKFLGHTFRVEGYLPSEKQNIAVCRLPSPRNA